jgi:hypothetical protein
MSINHITLGSERSTVENMVDLDREALIETARVVQSWTNDSPI